MSVLQKNGEWKWWFLCQFDVITQATTPGGGDTIGKLKTQERKKKK